MSCTHDLMIEHHLSVCPDCERDASEVLRAERAAHEQTKARLADVEARNAAGSKQVEIMGKHVRHLASELAPRFIVDICDGNRGRV